MKPINSTREILAFKVLNRDIDLSWISWAYEMLEAGFETKYLIQLAGETEPFNQFEMQELTTKVLNELNLDYSDKETVIKDYVSYEIEKYLEGGIDIINVLDKLKELHLETGEDYLYDFYLLYYAKTDLLESEDQWYIPGVGRNDIDAKILEHFTNWNSEIHEK